MAPLLRLAILALGGISVFLVVRWILLWAPHRRKRLGARVRGFSFEDMLAERDSCLLVLGAVGLVVSYAIDLRLVVPCAVAAFVFSRKVPELVERRRRQRVTHACEDELDMMADILGMGARAGLSFDASVDMYCSKFDGPLAERLHDARLQWASNVRTREQALNGMARELESKKLERFAKTSVQAIAHGSPLADMMGRFAQELRREKAALIESRVEKAPVRMMVPTGVCILPAMLILVMGPVILQFMESGF